MSYQNVSITEKSKENVILVLELYVPLMSVGTTRFPPCCGLNYITPIDMLKPYSPVTENMNLFGNRILIEAIQLK